MRPSALHKPKAAQRAAASSAPRVQSLVRAFAILETVARSREGIGLSELARALGLHSSTVFNLARTMTELSYLDQSPADRRYRVGRSTLGLGASAADDLMLVDKARAVMEDLSRVSGESGTFAVWTGDQVVALARSSGGGSFQLSDRVGGARPAYATATGKVLLAALAPERLEAYVAEARFERLTPRTIVDRRRLMAEIRRVREDGVALDRGEYREDVCCIAMPVRDFSGKVVGAMGLSGPVWRMTEPVRTRKAALLEKAAARLSAELGHGGFSETFSPALARLTEARRRADTSASEAPGTSAHSAVRHLRTRAASGRA